MRASTRSRAHADPAPVLWFYPNFRDRFYDCASLDWMAFDGGVGFEIEIENPQSMNFFANACVQISPSVLLVLFNRTLRTSQRFQHRSCTTRANVHLAESTPATFATPSSSTQYESR